MHALSSRITSLYWFNLSLKSLMKFPDTWEPIARIGREIRMLEPFLLEGDAYDFESLSKADGTPDWELASIASPTTAILFANDTAYVPDPVENVFKFGPPRAAAFRFRLPPWLREPVEVFRIDADGAHAIVWAVTGERVTIQDHRSLDAVYIATTDTSVRAEILQRRQTALDRESANVIDMESLKAIGK